MNLKIKKNDYGLRIYCTKCKKQYNYHNELCGHYDTQHYKSIVSYNSTRKVKFHQTREFDRALTSAIQFKRDVKNGVLVNDKKQNTIDINNISIIDAAEIFLRYKNGIDVPEHLKQNLDKDYLANLKYTIQQLIDILKTNNINVENINIKDLNDIHVGHWFKYVKDKYAKTTLPSKLKIVRCFINHMIKNEGVTMYNPFLKVKFDTPEYDTSGITEVEFKSVLDAIDNKNPYHQLGGKGQEVKNRYRTYLKDGFKLALYTGLRREELVALSWNDIFYSDKSNCLMLALDNLKVERITGKKYKSKYVPVNDGLLNLLKELGYEDLRGSDLFILHPRRKTKHTTIMNSLSKGFSHYYKQAFPELEPKKFKTLRKTYLSYLNKSVGDDMIELSSHSGMKVLKKHYLDAEIVSKGLSVKIFE